MNKQMNKQTTKEGSEGMNEVTNKGMKKGMNEKWAKLAPIITMCVILINLNTQNFNSCQ